MYISPYRSDASSATSSATVSNGSEPSYPVDTKLRAFSRLLLDANRDSSNTAVDGRLISSANDKSTPALRAATASLFAKTESRFRRSGFCDRITGRISSLLLPNNQRQSSLSSGFLVPGTGFSRSSPSGLSPMKEAMPSYPIPVYKWENEKCL